MNIITVYFRPHEQNKIKILTSKHHTLPLKYLKILFMCESNMKLPNILFVQNLWFPKLFLHCDMVWILTMEAYNL